MTEHLRMKLGMFWTASVVTFETEIDSMLICLYIAYTRIETFGAFVLVNELSVKVEVDIIEREVVTRHFTRRTFRRSVVRYVSHKNLRVNMA